MLEQLVLEQVDAKHGEETTSPRNSPVFVRKKKTGKWWITDLRVINKKIQTMLGITDFSWKNTHLLEAMAVMGILIQLKTGNGPAYASSMMKGFFLDIIT